MHAADLEPVALRQRQPFRVEVLDQPPHGGRDALVVLPGLAAFDAGEVRDGVGEVDLRVEVAQTDPQDIPHIPEAGAEERDAERSGLFGVLEPRAGHVDRVAQCAYADTAVVALRRGHGGRPRNGTDRAACGGKGGAQVDRGIGQFRAEDHHLFGAQVWHQRIQRRPIALRAAGHHQNLGEGGGLFGSGNLLDPVVALDLSGEMLHPGPAPALRPEPHVMPRLLQQRAIGQADGAAPDNSCFHSVSSGPEAVLVFSLLERLPGRRSSAGT